MTVEDKFRELIKISKDIDSLSEVRNKFYKMEVDDGVGWAVASKKMNKIHLEIQDLQSDLRGLIESLED